MLENALPLDCSAEDRRASSLTSCENLSAPDARDARAKLAVLAAAVPRAAASLRPDPKAVSAIRSAALMASSELSGFFAKLVFFEFFSRFFTLLKRDALANSVVIDDWLVSI